MTLLSFEGIDVDIPSVDGLRFYFENGQLAIECTNFTGCFALAKARATDSTMVPKPANKRSVDAASPIVIYEDPAKRQKVRASSSDRSSAEEDDAMVHPPKTTPRKPLQPLPTVDADTEAKETAVTPSPSPTGKAKGKRGRPSKKTENTKKTTEVVKKATEPTTVMSFFTPKKDQSSKDDTPKPEPEAAKAAPSSVVVPMSPESAVEDTHPTSSSAPLSLQLYTGTYARVEVSGDIPAQRWGATATAIDGNRVVLYGGESEDETTLADMHVYDAATRSWSRPANCESLPRAWHSAVSVPQRKLLLVFGGERLVNGAMDSLADLMVLDTECFLWYPPATHGALPSERSGHTMCLLGSDVVVFGGSRGRSRMNSIHLLSTEDWAWSNIKVEGRAPQARNYHSAVAMGPNRMVIFGGNDTKRSFDSVHVLERRAADGAWFWFHPSTSGEGPAPRTGQAAVALDASTLVIYGGWDPQYTAPQNTKLFGDVFALDTETWEWKAIAMANADGMQRVGHCAVLGNNGAKELLIFGGQDVKETRISDVYSLQLA
ncbi:Rab9 effector protein [Achlya hypogyna]|uniref:Rab9 effector protein n=1 Tax=Achlya hypogyna TaxID=1202772 RepID=A0A1V9YLZ4_ACHHY|nr:Rab9 effector protein [Achlya hypogyna]